MRFSVYYFVYSSGELSVTTSVVSRSLRKGYILTQIIAVWYLSPLDIFKWQFKALTSIMIYIPTNPPAEQCYKELNQSLDLCY